MPFFYHEDRNVRQATVEILELRDEPVPLELLMDLLSDEDSAIRQIALRILQKQSPQMLSDLASQALAVLDGQTMGQVFPTLIQMHVADTIGELGIIASTTLLEKLTELLDWPHWQIRIKAAQALGQIRRNIPDEAIQRLLELRRDPNPNMRAVRDAADDALAEILSLETGIEDD